MAFNQEIIYQTHVTIIVALSETEVGKVLLPNPVQWVNSKGEPVELGFEPTLEDEMIKLIFANSINDLLPKFIGKQEWTNPETGETHDMIIMERLYELPKNHFDRPTRERMITEFEAKMKALHDKFFAHGDLMRPTRFWNRNDMEWIFGNIIQTQDRLRLIDTGFSKYLHYNTETEDDRKSLVRLLYYEKQEVLGFKEYYLGLE